MAIESGACLSFEVIPRRIDDRGGGLAKVAGRVRLLEGLAQPREETEFSLRLLQHAHDLGPDRWIARGLWAHTRCPQATIPPRSPLRPRHGAHACQLM